MSPRVRKERPVKVKPKTGDELKADLDALLSEIDSALEDNVKNLDVMSKCKDN